MLAMSYRGPQRVRVGQKLMPEILHPQDAIVRVTRSCICDSYRQSRSHRQCGHANQASVKRLLPRLIEHVRCSCCANTNRVNSASKIKKVAMFVGAPNNFFQEDILNLYYRIQLRT